MFLANDISQDLEMVGVTNTPPSIPTSDTSDNNIDKRVLEEAGLRDFSRLPSLTGYEPSPSEPLTPRSIREITKTLSSM